MVSEVFGRTTEARTMFLVELLLNRGANIAARSNAGQTPLHVAAALGGTSAVMEMLLDEGADASARDENGKTAFDLIQENPYLQGSEVYWRLNETRFQ